MTTASRILLIGAGAQAKTACETFSFYDHLNPVCIIATDGSGPMEWPSAYGVDLIVGFAAIEKMAKSGEADSAIVCIPDAQQKRIVEERALRAGLKIVSAVHPRATVATTSTIGDGTIIDPGAVIQPFCTIGRGVMIHGNVVIAHDCKIGDYASLAPGSALAGWVELGAGAHVYTGACVKPTCKIGVNATIGAGATVISDVPANATFVGVPARSLEKPERNS